MSVNISVVFKLKDKLKWSFVVINIMSQMLLIKPSLHWNRNISLTLLLKMLSCVMRTCSLFIHHYSRFFLCFSSMSIFTSLSCACVSVLWVFLVSVAWRASPPFCTYRYFFPHLDSPRTGSRLAHLLPPPSLVEQMNEPDPTHATQLRHRHMVNSNNQPTDIFLVNDQ